ncbi:hypothetical protein Hamer_G016218, partial [Homarus americanus]
MMARGVRSSSGQRSLMVVVTLGLLHLLRTVMSYSSGVGAATGPLQDSDVFSQSQFSTRPLGFLRSQAVRANKLVGSSGGGMRCEIGSDLVAAVIDMINTITPTHLHLVTQHDPESCLVEGLWEKGVGVAVMGYTHWWGLLQQSSYLLPSQHILVGDIYWISTIMVQVKPLYNSGKINSMRTRWMWVSTSLPTTPESLPAASSFPVITAPLNLASDIPDRHSIRVVPSSSSSSSPSSPPAGAAFISSRTKTSESQPFNAEKIITRHHNSILSSTAPMSQSFLHALDVVSDALQEGMRGVLLADLHQQSTSSAGVPLYRWVAVGGVEAPGDGSWRLVVAASWTNQHLDTYRPLWPPLSYNLHQRVVRLTCTQ